ncbi:non-ribosomal peptide synthetase module [Truncatella angustata]|uniref:Non-ribosomal peptide synthetase module n=1 Tax=Truncatella angustata TaxID=152316 RepID=A0A9P8UE00_9PEZI|nr:non-ribosomal peptide synthetase module [Truncatella angustata]KAH6648185.1 non-ribosomal peptide synthetase module [Truncatella angustata]
METASSPDEPPKPFSLIRDGLPLQTQIELIAQMCMVPSESIQNAYPCTPLQESLVGSGDENAYVRQIVLTLSDDTPLDRFKRAWEETFRANHVMRTRIVHLGGQVGYVQAVIDEAASWNQVTDSLARFLEEDARLPMTLGDRFFRYSIVVERSCRCFVLTAHHALFDGASIMELVDESSKRFSGEAVEQRQPFELFVQATVTMADTKRQEDFWKSSLASVDATAYPTIPRDPDFRAHPATELVRPVDLPSRLLVRGGPTAALLLRAAWGILLSHHTGTEDVVFGVVANGRRTASIPGISRMTGPTVTIHPVALHVDSKESVATFISRVQHQASDTRPFEQTGMSRIRRVLASSERYTMAEFQSLFVINPADFGEFSAIPLRELGVEYHGHLGKKERHPYPLVVTVTLLTHTTGTAQMEYDERVISPRHAQNLMDQFQAVLTGLGNVNSDALVGSISPLNKHDIDQIRLWNAITPPAEQMCLHHLFMRQARKQPLAEAVCSVDKSLTYAEVDIMSSTIAMQLIELGVYPETFVAVCFEKNIYTVVAILAVLKAGGVYLPIDPAHPRGRIVEILETVPVKAALVSAASSQVLEGLCDRIMVVDNLPPSSVSSLPMAPLERARPFNNAYLLFTSGSTGKPKGMLISHSAICTSIVHHGPAFKAGSHWRTLQFGAHTFDMSIGEFFTTLSFGGCVCVPSEHERLNDLPRAIATLNANTLLVVPTVVNLLNPEQVPTLKTIVLGGEPITKGTIIKWAPYVQLTASYGPSETAIWCSANVDVTADADPSNIGKAVGGTMWIVDSKDHHKLTPIGCVGEIVISGALLASGYFNNKSATDASFVPAPDWMRSFNHDSPYQVIYKSGDLGRYSSDGSFQIIGRKDTQVKFRGFRIELGEIENRTMDHSMATAAFAALPKEGPCARHIVAVVSFKKQDIGNFKPFDVTVSEDTKDDDRQLEALKSHLRLTLPTYMLPSYWIVLDKLPFLISGKVDRRTLTVWISTMSQHTFRKLSQAFDADEMPEILPGTIADILRQIWSDVLGVPHEQIQMHTSFLSIGGDSFAAIQVVSAAKKRGLSLTVSKVLNTRSLGDLASVVEQELPVKPLPLQQTTDAQRIKLPIAYEKALQPRLAGRPSVELEEVYPLAPIQLEVTKQRAIDPAVFIFSWVMEISSKTTSQVSLDSAMRAWKRVVQKRPIFRTTFMQDPSQKAAPLQVVLRNAEPDMARSSSPAENFDKILPAVDECFLPYRVHFLGHDSKVIIRIELDHRLIDGWSLKLIKQDLLAAYDTDEATLPVEQASYKSFIDTLHPDRIHAARKHWASVLRGQRPSLLYLPTKGHKQSMPGTSSGNTTLRLPAVDGRSLFAFSAQHGVTAASIFEAAWAQTLSVCTRSPDVSFEYVVSGRDQDTPGILEIVGPLINILAYHLHDVLTDPDPLALARLAQQIQEQRLQDGQHTACNVREVLEHDLRVANPFNTGVNFQRRPSAVESETLKIEDDLVGANDPWHFEVLVRILHLVDNDTMWPSLEFDGRLFDETQMRAVLDIFWSRIRMAISRSMSKL